MQKHMRLLRGTRSKFALEVNASKRIKQCGGCNCLSSAIRNGFHNSSGMRRQLTWCRPIVCFRSRAGGPRRSRLSLRPGEPAELLDLCSGAGGAITLILAKLEAHGYQAKATLTDLYPNRNAIPGPRISWFPQSVDATDVPAEMAGVRTIFSGFHHFRVTAAKAILKDAFDRRRSICIFEAGTRTVGAIVMTIVIPINVLFLMPIARPFRWVYLVFTYLVPLIPLMIFWDGLVSTLRVYSPNEMREMTADLHAPDYVWDFGYIEMRGVPVGLPYLIGHAADAGLSKPERKTF